MLVIGAPEECETGGIAIFRANLTAVKFHSVTGVVHGEWVSAPQEVEGVPRRRGDRQRRAIVQAVCELLTEKPFAALSVSSISDRAGVARSGFYFYFDSDLFVDVHVYVYFDFYFYFYFYLYVYFFIAT
jgi:hypothetical protein